MPADYVPYGPEWEAEMMRMRKKDLVDMVRRAIAKEEKFTSYNKQSTPCSFRAKCPVDKGPGCERVEPRPCFKS